jgi:hypothetical protein
MFGGESPNIENMSQVWTMDKILLASMAVGNIGEKAAKAIEILGQNNGSSIFSCCKFGGLKKLCSCPSDLGNVRVRCHYPMVLRRGQ